MALWSVGLVVYVVGATAATTSLVHRDLYVDTGGDVCTGGSVLDACYGIDASTFSPPPPDLSSFKPRGFGYVEPAQVPGGSMYVGNCHVVAVELNGRTSSRSEFGMLSLLSQLRWALPLAILLVAAAGAILARTEGLSRPLKRALYSAVLAEAGLAVVYALAVGALGSPALGQTVAEVAVVLFVVAVLLALGGLLLSVGSVIQLALVPVQREGLRLGGLMVGGAVAIAASLVLLALHALGSLWC